ESALPANWRVLWVMNGPNLTLIPLDSLATCLEPTAHVASISSPATVADSAGNISTAHFCAADNRTTTVAEYILHLPAGRRGNFKVVAIAPSDSTQVIQSGVVICNGGLGVAFEPTILNAASAHPASELTVSLLGDALGDIDAAALEAPDSSWR